MSGTKPEPTIETIELKCQIIDYFFNKDGFMCNEDGEPTVISRNGKPILIRVMSLS